MPFLEGLKWYYRLGGIRAVVTLAGFRIAGWPRTFQARIPGSRWPALLRIDTSDFCSYYDVFVSGQKQYDPGELGFIARTIVDVGAHIGMVSIQFARRYPSAKIIAVEPEPSNFALLRQNTSPYKNIFCVEAALWKNDGEVALGASEAHVKGAFQIVENGRTRVRAITMHTLMREAGITEIDILKVDIEGAEQDVFDSCDWVDNVRFLAIELHDRVRAGCRSTVEAAAGGFRSAERGDVAVFFREPRKPTTDSACDPLARSFAGHQLRSS